MSLYAAWAFNEGSGSTITDHSGNGRDMTISGSGSTWVTGVNYPNAFLAGASGSGAAWDGGSLLAALSGDVTLMGWYQHQGGSTTQEHAFGLFSAAATARLAVYSYRSLSGVAASPQLTVRNGSSTVFSFGANGTSADNSWHHVAVVYHSSGTVDEYLDGTLVNNYAASAAIGTEVRFAGSSSILAGATAMSAVQDVRLFDSALTGTDIATFMAEPVDGGGGTTHNATASLTVTPSLAAAPAASHVPSASLTVTPSLAASGARGRSRSASLAVVPSLSAPPAAGHLPAASLSVVPSLSAAGDRAAATSHTSSASLTIRPVLLATALHVLNPALLPDWPDVERALGDFLAGLGTCGGETPKTLQSDVPYLRITRTGGSDDHMVTDRASVSVDVFAASRSDAKTIAGQVRQMLLNELPAATDHGILDRATTQAGPTPLPPTDSDNLRLAVASYLVSMRLAQ